MNGPITRSASFQTPTTTRLEGAGPNQALGVPQRLSQAVSALPARALSMHTGELKSLLSDRLSGAQRPQVEDSVSQSQGGEFGTEELNQASAVASQPPFSIAEALDFRTMMSEGGRATASQLIEHLQGKHDLSSDSGVQHRLNQAVGQLQDFKIKLAEDLYGVRGKAEKIRVQPGASAAQQLGEIKALMGGQIREPNSLKNLWKFSFSDNRRAKAQLKGIEHAAKQGRPFEPPGPPVHLQAAMTAYLKGTLKRAGLDDKAQIKAVKGDLAKQMAHHNERHQKWETIENTIALKGMNAQETPFSNRITPARLFSEQVAQTYTGGQKGVSCLNNTNATQTANLWKTDFQAQGGGAKFSALRHGIHDAYKIKDVQAREAAASQKVDQFLRAAVDAYPEKLKPNADGTFSLDLVSVSLVSPGKFGGEGDMWAQQRAAYEKANGQELTMRADLGDGHGPRDITVKPNILAFSTPVNSPALDSAVLRPFLGGLSVSQQANEASITGLIGSSAAGSQTDGLAGEKLKDIDQQIEAAERGGQDTSALNAHRERITGLVEQVRQIMNAPAGSPMSWQRAGNEPYKLASRLTALANEVGAVPAFNCKSGKDRTGELDVQVKQLYAYNHHEGKWPTPNEKEDELQAQNHVKLVREGGSFQIQKDNTSLPGSKVEIKALVKPLLHAMRTELPSGLNRQQREEQVPKEAFKGLSAWVGS
jgi:phosphatidylinositol-4,5-bisphosphate 4-phosphatase